MLFLLGATALLAAQSALVLVASGTADSIAVIGHAGMPGEGAVVLHAHWTGLHAGEPAFALDRLPAAEGQVQLTELVLSGVEQYLDQRIHFTRTGVQTDLPVPLLQEGVNGMLASTAAYFGAPRAVLSEATVQQLRRVCAIDWSQASFGVDGGDDQEKYLAISFYVRAQRQELERRLRQDLVPFAGLQLPVPPDVAHESGSPARNDSVFDEENYMRALDLRADSLADMPDIRLTDAMLAEIAEKAGQETEAPPAYRIRKRDRWLKAELDAINRRIDQVDQRKELWAMRDRMDAMEERLEALGGQVDELERARHAPASGNPVADLSTLTGRNVRVLFASGSDQLDADARSLLEEVAKAMRESPEGRALVTGHADRSGNAARNLALSEARAKQVRDFLIAKGVGGERLMLNFYGDSQSHGQGQAERKVEIEWLR